MLQVGRTSQEPSCCIKVERVNTYVVTGGQSESWNTLIHEGKSSHKTRCYIGGKRVIIEIVTKYENETNRKEVV